MIEPNATTEASKSNHLKIDDTQKEENEKEEKNSFLKSVLKCLQLIETPFNSFNDTLLLDIKYIINYFIQQFRELMHKKPIIEEKLKKVIYKSNTIIPGMIVDLERLYKNHSQTYIEKASILRLINDCLRYMSEINYNHEVTKSKYIQKELIYYNEFLDVYNKEIELFPTKFDRYKITLLHNHSKFINSFCNQKEEALKIAYSNLIEINLIKENKEIFTDEVEKTYKLIMEFHKTLNQPKKVKKTKK